MYVLQSSKRSSLNRLCLTLQLTSRRHQMYDWCASYGVCTFTADIELALLGYVRGTSEAFLMFEY